MEEEKKEINPDDLPQSEVFKRKEIFQHPQPADTGKPLNVPVEKEDNSIADHGKESNKTSKEEGLNEARSPGSGGPFEGIEKMNDE